jgi:hypothetical protein
MTAPEGVLLRDMFPGILEDDPIADGFGPVPDLGP